MKSWKLSTSRGLKWSSTAVRYSFGWKSLAGPRRRHPHQTHCRQGRRRRGRGLRHTSRRCQAGTGQRRIGEVVAGDARDQAPAPMGPRKVAKQEREQAKPEPGTTGEHGDEVLLKCARRQGTGGLARLVRAMSGWLDGSLRAPQSRAQGEKRPVPPGWFPVQRQDAREQMVRRIFFFFFFFFLTGGCRCNRKPRSGAGDGGGPGFAAGEGLPRQRRASRSARPRWWLNALRAAPNSSSALVLRHRQRVGYPVTQILLPRDGPQVANGADPGVATESAISFLVLKVRAENAGASSG